MAKGLPKAIIKKYGISKKAWEVFRGKKSLKTTSTPSSTKKRSNPRMARRRYYKGRGRRRGGFTLPIAPIAGIMGGIAMARHPHSAETVVSKLMKGNYEEAFGDLGPAFTGFTADGKFHVQTLLATYGPMVVGGLIHYFVGGRMGINAMLGRAKVPILRV